MRSQSHLLSQTGRTLESLKVLRVRVKSNQCVSPRSKWKRTGGKIQSDCTYDHSQHQVGVDLRIRLNLIVGFPLNVLQNDTAVKERERRVALEAMKDVTAEIKRLKQNEVMWRRQRFFCKK